jgi:hypothetical protein
VARLETEVFADYFQILLLDARSETDTSDGWDDLATARRLVAAGDALAMLTARNTTVPVTVDVVPGRVAVDPSAYDHVVEADLVVPSGVLVVMGPTDYLPDAKRLTVAPGRYRVLACSSGLAEVSEDGLEGRDAYRFTLWPSDAPAPVMVGRQAS